MITEELKNNYLLKYFDNYNIIPFYQFNATSHIKHYKNTINKFYAYNFTQYKKLIFLDADLILVKNIDNLFFADVEFACATYTPLRFEQSICCPLNGCALFTPDKNKYNFICQAVEKDNTIYVDDESVIYHLLYPFNFKNKQWDKYCATYESLGLVNGQIVYVHNKNLYKYSIYNAKELEEIFMDSNDKFFNYLLTVYQHMCQYTTKKKSYTQDDIIREWQKYGSLIHYVSED